MTKLTPHRATLGEYFRAGRHLLSPTRAKTVRQIAVETGMSIRTVRHWAKVDHYDIWFEWWPSFDAIWAEAREDKPLTNSPPATYEFPDIDAALAEELRDERY